MKLSRILPSVGVLLLHRFSPSQASSGYLSENAPELLPKLFYLQPSSHPVSFVGFLFRCPPSLIELVERIIGKPPFSLLRDTNACRLATGRHTRSPLHEIAVTYTVATWAPHTLQRSIPTTTWSSKITGLAPSRWPISWISYQRRSFGGRERLDV